MAWFQVHSSRAPTGVVLTGLLAVAAIMVMVASVQSFVGHRGELLTRPVQEHLLERKHGNRKTLAERKAGAKALKQWEDKFFHPLPKGIKLTQAMRTKMMSTRQNSLRSKLGKKAQAYEDATFQPLGHGAISDELRFKLFNAGQRHQLTGKANKWQNWEDNMFGHSMKDVASRRLPEAIANTNMHEKKSKQNTLLDKLVSQSWTTQAETGGNIGPKKVQRFIDTLKR